MLHSPHRIRYDSFPNFEEMNSTKWNVVKERERKQKLDIGRSLKLVSEELFRNCRYNF